MTYPEHAAAAAWFAAGCTPVPIRLDGSKAPLGEWRQFIPAPAVANAAALAEFDRSAAAGVAILCGGPSSNLEMLEFEGNVIREQDGFAVVRWHAYQQGIGELFDRITAGYLETSPKGGLHLFYRLADAPVPGNKKVATRPARADEMTPDEAGRAAKGLVPKRTLVETRGHGGYVIVAPTRAEASDPAGPYGQQPWTLNAGHPSTIVTITKAERDQLHALVASALHVDAPARPVPEQRSAAALAYDGNERPGDRYAREHTWQDILGPLGWEYLYEHGGKTYWRRPGKNTGVSATTTDDYPGDPGGLYVFTTSTSFEAETLYTKFGAYSHLEHGGNMAAAAGELAGVDPEPVYSPFFTGWLAAPAPSPTSAPNGEPAPVSDGSGPGAAVDDPTNPFAAIKARLGARLRTTFTIDDIELPHYIVTDWINDDEIAQIIGASGSMKSFAAIDLACSIGCGIVWHGYKVEQRNTMFVAAEGGSGIRKRLRAWEKEKRIRAHNVIILDEPVQIASRIGRTLQASFAWQALAEIVHETKTAVLFVDTQARSTVGINENDNSEMGAVFEAIDQLRRAVRNHLDALGRPDGHKVTVVLVHHTGKSGTDGRGASAMYAAVNTEIKVTKIKVGAGKVIKVENSKNKDDDTATPLYLEPQVIPLDPNELTTDASVRPGDEATSSIALTASTWRPPREELQGRAPAANASDGVAAVLSAFLAVIGDTRQTATKGEIKSVCESMPKTTFYNSWNAAKERRLIVPHASGRSNFMITNEGRSASGIPDLPENGATP